MKLIVTLLALTASMGLTAGCATANSAESTEAQADLETGRVVVRVKEPGRQVIRINRGFNRVDSVDGIIANYDEDDDGRISREEYHAKRNRDRFDELDSNDDGYVDEEELEEMITERVELAMEGLEGRMEKLHERFGEGGEFQLKMEGLHEHIEDLTKNAELHGQRVIERLDRNGDGEINEDDFEGLTEFNFNFDDEGWQKRVAESRQRRLESLDSDGDGSISREEFAQRRHEQFEELDENGDGVLSEDELGDGFFFMGDSGPNVMFLDGDGHDFEFSRDFGRDFGRAFRGFGRDFGRGMRWQYRDSDEDDENLEDSEQDSE